MFKNKQGAAVSIIYLLGVVFVNLGFAWLPMFETPLGPLPMMAFFVGAIFILRDFAQRYIGHHVIIPMIIATVIVWIIADPVLALASSAAFFISEFTDWLIYTVTQKPFHDRIVISSAVSIPVDTVVFLGILGYLSWGSFIVMNLSKFVASAIIWYIWKYHRPPVELGEGHKL